jgi:hypothetical protein
LADFTIRNDGVGYFQQVTALLESPSLPNNTSVAELVASVPEARGFLPGTTNEPMPLEVTTHVFDNVDLAATGMFAAWVTPLPDQLIPESPILNPVEPQFLPSHAEVLEWLAPYSTLTGDGAPAAVAQLQKAEASFDPENRILLRWGNAGAAPMNFAEQHEAIKRVIDYPDGGVWGEPLEGLAIPTVGGNDRALHPLAAWWAILYAMSMVARYEPNRWTRLLHPDSSAEAERVREVLETAADVLPWLVLAQVLEVGH